MLSEELNLSRNTVAKALCNDNKVALKTRQRVIKKAQEMHYGNLDKVIEDSVFPDTTPVRKGSILFLAKAKASDSEFWTAVIRGLEPTVSAEHYRLAISIMSESDIGIHKLPDLLSDPDIKGIILVEICDTDVCNEILKYNIPTVSIDMPYHFEDLNKPMDIITMENKSNITKIVDSLICKGAKSFAFIGDIYSTNASRGLHERYISLCDALSSHQLDIDKNSSLLHDPSGNNFQNFQHLLPLVKEMVKLPDVFICGNDVTALQLMNALQILGYEIPRDVSIVGFDNIPASEKSVPSLTTISTPKKYLGIAAGKRIIEKIQNPGIPKLYAEYSTELIVRGSTK